MAGLENRECVVDNKKLENVNTVQEMVDDLFKEEAKNRVNFLLGSLKAEVSCEDVNYLEVKDGEKLWDIAKNSLWDNPSDQEIISRINDIIRWNPEIDMDTLKVENGILMKGEDGISGDEIKAGTKIKVYGDINYNKNTTSAQFIRFLDDGKGAGGGDIGKGNGSLDDGKGAGGGDEGKGNG